MTKLIDPKDITQVLKKATDRNNSVGDINDAA